MKQISEYITEKAKFLVKKHVKSNNGTFYEGAVKLLDSLLGEFTVQDYNGEDMDNSKWWKEPNSNSEYLKRWYYGIPKGFWKDFQPSLTKELEAFANEQNCKVCNNYSMLTVEGKNKNNSTTILLGISSYDNRIYVQILNEFVPDEDIQ